MNIEQLTLRTRKTASGSSAYIRFEKLVAQVADDGVLTREENELVMVAMTSCDRPTAEMCSLFRQLQERVWNGELLLDD